MRQAEIRIIEDQKEEITPANISDYEREMLLGKYGYKPQPTSYTEPQTPPVNNLTFEEMCKIEEDRINQERYRKSQQINGPKPMTFGGDNYNTDTSYGTDTDSGMSFRINIVSDMYIPKNY